MKLKKGTSWQQSIQEIGPYIDLGIRFAVSLVIGLFGGYWLDRRFHTMPLFLLLGIFFGAIAGFWSIYKTVYMKRQNKKEK